MPVNNNSRGNNSRGTADSIPTNFDRGLEPMRDIGDFPTGKNIMCNMKKKFQN